MAQTLSSPGVSVAITDESAYTAAPAGTIPLIFVASASNKLTDAGTSIAPGTLAENDGKVYLLTGQKDLLDTFGTPKFIADTSNNAQHAHEQNEYGLQTAYSYLGVANRAYVARASVDLTQLTGTTIIPEGVPEDGSFWLDTSSSKWGIFEWDGRASQGTVNYSPTGQTFVNKVPMIITDLADVTGSTPKASVGAPGSYAIVAVSSLIKLWYKKPSIGTSLTEWVEVGTPAWSASRPAIVSLATVVDDDISTTDELVITAGDLLPQTFTGHETLQAIVDAINNSAINNVVSAKNIDSKLYLYSTGVDINLSNTNAAAYASLQLSSSNTGTTTGTTYYAPRLTIAPHTAVPDYKIKTNNRPTGSIWIKTTPVNLGTDLLLSYYSKAAKSWLPKTVSVYPNNASALNGLDSSGGGLNIVGNTVYAKSNDAELTPTSASFKLYRRSATTATTIDSVEIKKSLFAPSSASTFLLSESVPGSNSMITRTVTVGAIASDSTVQSIIDKILLGINAVRSNVTAKQVGGKIVITHATGGEIEFAQTGTAPNNLITKLFGNPSTPTGLASAALNFYAHPGGDTTITINGTPTVHNRYVASLWTEYTTDRSSSFVHLSDTEPTAGPVDGQLWFDSKVEDVDLMFCDIINGTPKWVAFNNYDSGGIRKNPAGPFVTATKPKLQSDGGALAEGDIWVDMSDLNNYPKIYRYIDFDKQWELMDVTDHTTENGIIFADARWSTSGGADAGVLSDMLGGFVEGGELTYEQSVELNNAANFVDFDAPNPALYPKGTLLWNTRRSGNNVKKYHKAYINPLRRNTRVTNELMNATNGYTTTARWVTESGNQSNGVGSFGYKAQRKVVIQSLQALVNSNLQIRDTEQRVFNLMATPGYPELVGEMRVLNADRGLTAFIVADTPARLAANATDLSNWGHNAKLATEDNDDGLVSADPYVAFFYPWGMQSDNKGLNVVLPPSYMMLTTIALNDQKTYPWFAPAGTNRGSITNISSTGYVTSAGKYQTVALNNGMRDTLADIKVNPITYLDGQGIVNFGQYTRSPNTSSMDRINVVRLVVYLRRQLERVTRPFLFEPNDANTRAQAKHQVEVIFSDVMSKRGIMDFVVQCDGQNNTPDKIDRSELWIDVAIQPMKAVEFIYIPLRLRNTGESLK